jgi:hypothetical protein
MIACVEQQQDTPNEQRYDDTEIDKSIRLQGISSFVMRVGYSRLYPTQIVLLITFPETQLISRI